MVTFDAASADRLGLLQPSASAAGELIVLDHHASNTGFGTIGMVDPGAAATAVLAHELIGRLGVPVYQGHGARPVRGPGHRHGLVQVPDDIAAGYMSWPRDCWRPASSRERWRTSCGTARRLALWACCRQRSGGPCWSPAGAGGHGLVWTTVTRADRAAGGLSLEAAESVIDVVRRADEADVAVVLKESDDGQWQVSARSKGKVDVGRACVALGGGGHPRAAGFTARGTAQQVLAALREQLAEPMAGGR